MNHTAYAKTIFSSRNFRIQRADLDDVVQSALADALTSGLDVNDNRVKGYIFISCLRFIQTTCKRKPTERIRPSHKVGEATQLADLSMREDVALLEADIKSLPISLQEVMKMTLTGMDAVQIATVRKVKPTTVRVDRCRAYGTLRILRKIA